MPKYLINEGRSKLPTMNVRVEAAKYEEKGSFTVFLDEDGSEVLSMKTDNVRTIRTEG